MVRTLRDFLLLDSTQIRNYGLFSLVLISSAGLLIYILVAGERTISRIDDQVEHTYTVIDNAQSISAMVQGMLASQRAFVLTRHEKFLDKYHARRDKVSEIIANLAELTRDNEAQASRLDEMRHHFNEFSVQLEQRAQTITITTESKISLDDFETTDSMQETILRINNAILRDAYELLNSHVNSIETQKSNYFVTLLIGICVSCALLFLFNGFLLRAQRKRTYFETSLRDTEERFALAIEGTQDGIFDWNLKTGDVFYTRRFFEMLGYNKEPFIGTRADFTDLVHPEDLPRVLHYTEQYLRGDLSDYTQDFRMKAKDGRWIWINARAKVIIEPGGKPIRMVGAHTNIMHTKTLEERLKAEKQQAEDANRAKSDFLAHMSHEIRTPLTAISGIAEIFEKSQSNFDEKEQKLLHTLRSSASILKDLVTDILDFSKIESGELELESKEFDLGRLFDEIVSMMAVRANERGISFVLDYTPVENTPFIGDEARLRQIIINLVGNALKFTEKGGVIVKAYHENRESGDILRIDVRDTGIGIAPENFDCVFDRFKQADSSVSRKYGGTGLGLPISKNLAKLMGGDIVLSSELGKGSVFSILLPWKAAGAQPSDLYVSKTSPLRKVKSSLKGRNKILLVEDYEGNIVVLSYILDDMGYSYDIARTGKEALDMWQDRDYDLILMDIQMPQMDGFTATEAIRKQEVEKGAPRTPIVGMTAHALIGDKNKCIAAGMDAYLPKPIVEDDLRREILKYIGKKKQIAA